MFTPSRFICWDLNCEYKEMKKHLSVISRTESTDRCQTRTKPLQEGVCTQKEAGKKLVTQMKMSFVSPLSPFYLWLQLHCLSLFFLTRLFVWLLAVHSARSNIHRIHLLPSLILTHIVLAWTVCFCCKSALQSNHVQIFAFSKSIGSNLNVTRDKSFHWFHLTQDCQTQTGLKYLSKDKVVCQHLHLQKV